MKIENKELVMNGMVPKAFEIYHNDEGLFFVCLSVYVPGTFTERLLSFRELDKFCDLPSFAFVKDMIENYAFTSEVVSDEEEWREGEFNVSRKINDGKYKLYSRVNFYNALEVFILNNPDSVSESFKAKFVETNGYNAYIDSLEEISFILFSEKNRIYRRSDYGEIMRCIKQQLNRKKTIETLMTRCLNERPSEVWAMQVYDLGPVKSGRSFNRRTYTFPVKTHLKDEIYAIST